MVPKFVFVDLRSIDLALVITTPRYRYWLLNKVTTYCSLCLIAPEIGTETNDTWHERSESEIGTVFIFWVARINGRRVRRCKNPIFKQHFRGLVRDSPLVCLSEHSITTAIRNTKKKVEERHETRPKLATYPFSRFARQNFRGETQLVALDNILECNMRIGKADGISIFEHQELSPRCTQERKIRESRT